MTARYRQNDKIFTTLTTVQYLLDEVDFVAKRDLSTARLLEPASGEGSFAVEVVKRLYSSSQRFGFDFIQALNSNIRFVELKEESIRGLQTNIERLIESWGYDFTLLDRGIFINADYLMVDFLTRFDCIVGNPPYIRHEIIDKSLKIAYKKRFSTFRYRADLYILFYEHSLNLLSNSGKLSFVSSNRWFYNQYGEPLREKIAKEYYLKKLLNIEKSRIFKNRVVAYPAIVTIESKKGTQTLYCEDNSKKIDFERLSFEKRKTPISSHWQNLFLDYDLDDGSLKGIEEQGFKIGIGVATGADSIFIIKKSQNIDIEESRLLPLLKSNALKGDSIEWDESFVINPYEGNKLCDLDKYPKLKAYLYKHKKRLQQRHTAKKNPLKWYKTIDRIKPDLLGKAKLLLPDLADSSCLHIDKGEFYPHHNLYYITHDDEEKLRALAYILMSDFVKEQLNQIGIRMNGGVVRFQAQTLRKIRVWDVDKIKKEKS